jgi:hypothetical protein
VELGPLLDAHAFLRVERPDLLWEADVDDEPLIRTLGEMIAAALARGTELADIVLNASNVTVEPDPDPESRGPLHGDYVALTISGAGDWSPEVTWKPTRQSTVLLNSDLDAAARTAGIPWAYTRSGPDGGSVTVFLPRVPSRQGS